MSSSGVTPLEGIPGETTCGAIDPGVILAMAEDLGWGPELINRVMTRESGLTGYAGRPVTFADLFEAHDMESVQLQEMVKYRLLLACGAGIAAMGGLDAIVFSGRYASLGRMLGPWLASFRGRKHRITFDLEILSESLDRAVADIAARQMRPGWSRPRGLPRTAGRPIR